MLPHSQHWACHISFHFCFSCHRCFQFTHIWQLLICSLTLTLLNEPKTSVSSRVAYLDYHCLLAQWMEVSISVTTAGFSEQTRNSKAALWLSLHQRSSQPLDMHCLVGSWKRHGSGYLISNSTVHQIMPENPTSSFDWNCWRSILSCVFTLWCVTWSNRVLCLNILRSLWNLFWYCKLCDFSKEIGCF